MRAVSLSPSAAAKAGLRVRQDGLVRNGLDLLRLGTVAMADLARIWPDLGDLRTDVTQQIEIEARYAAFLPRHLADIAAFRADQSLVLPPDLDVDSIAGLSREVRLRLKEVRPENLGAAARIPGMTPAALTLLYRHAKRAA